MLAYYRLARGAGHSIFKSLGFALFNWDLPSRADEIERQIAESQARIRKLEDATRQSR